MFTWVCPACGKELDVSIRECPNCGGRAAEAPAAPPARSNLRFWLGLAGGAVLGVCGLVLLVRYQGRPRSAAPETKAAPAVQANPAPSSGQELPAPAKADAAPAFLDFIEVAGIRTFYDDRNKPQVRALVVNHGDESLTGLALTVTLRPRQSAADAPPLARFTFKLGSDVKPGVSQEIQAPLESFATPAAMPHWREIRADLALAPPRGP